MKKIQATLRPFKLAEVRADLLEVGFSAMTITDVIGFHAGLRDYWGGRKVEKVMLEMVVPDYAVQTAIAVIEGSARTGRVGDGNIYVSTVEEAVRIRTGERHHDAL